MRAVSVAEVLSESFRAMLQCVQFDIGAAVMLEQNLELHVVAREGAAAVINDRFIGKIRSMLETIIPTSFTNADVVVASESADLAAGESADDPLRHSISAELHVENRTAGIILLFRDDPSFSAHEPQLLEIFAAQVAMLLAHLQAREQIQDLADTDDLTGIRNKRYFRKQLPQEMERARVYSLPLSLLMFDVDDFKDINDSFGHTIGDVVLSELCGAVRETLRPPDLFARFGGDEFAIILPHTDLGGACAVADRILEKVRGLQIPTDEEASIQCSVSIGVADYLPDDTLATELIRRADERLYTSKRQGKNRYTA